MLDTLAKRLPAASGSQGSIVFTAPEGERLDTPQRQAALAKAAADVYGLDLVVNPAEQAAAAAKQAQQAGPEAVQALQALQQATQKAAQQAAASGDQPRPLVVGGRPVPGILLSAKGDVALFQFQLTEQVQDLADGATTGLVETASKAAAAADLKAAPQRVAREDGAPGGRHRGLRPARGRARARAHAGLAARGRAAAGHGAGRGCRPVSVAPSPSRTCSR